VRIWVVVGRTEGSSARREVRSEEPVVVRKGNFERRTAPEL
jgi:hypothetical protein